MKTKIILIAIIGLIAYSCSQKPTYQYQFQNPALSFEERVENIISLLTVEEKIQQMVNNAPAIDTFIDEVIRRSICTY